MQNSSNLMQKSKTHAAVLKREIWLLIIVQVNIWDYIHLAALMKISLFSLHDFGEVFTLPM